MATGMGIREGKGVADVLDRFGEGELSAIQRALILQDGTMQTLLSAIHEEPVEASVISCLHYGAAIVRWARLTGAGSGDTHALAQSIIPTSSNPEAFVRGIEDEDQGIAQLIRAHDYTTERTVLGLEKDDSTGTLARVYRLRGDVEVLLTEVFFGTAG